MSRGVEEWRSGGVVEWRNGGRVDERKSGVDEWHRLQTTQPTSGGSVTSVTNFGANCVEISSPPEMEAQFIKKTSARECNNTV